VALICGYHHVSLPVTNVLGSSDWYERVFGFARVVIEEQEDSVVEPSALHEAHLGWAVDLLDPDGTCIQLHTAEAVSVEDV
jgi:catechol 2,3-dioxygenase-like lactoylglutathione lyase family enzyme